MIKILRSHMIFITALVVLIILIHQKASSQLTVAPSILVINSKSSIGNLFISNSSSLPQEVSIEFAFGYPDVDSAGNSIMNYKDSVAANTYSLNPFLKAYPRTFLLEAKQQQTVRLQVRTKGNAKDAFYFTRVKVTSTQKTPDIEKKITDAITTQISFKFDQILPVFYHKGNVTTGLDLHDVSTSIKENKLMVVADVERTGTAPYIGSMKAELYSPANEKVALSEATASIYFRMKNKMELDLSKAGKGVHRLLLTFETKRSDIAVEDLLQAPPVTKEVTVNLP